MRRKTAYDYAYEKSQLMAKHRAAAASGEKEPFWQGLHGAGIGAGVGAGLGLLTAFGRVPMPVGKAVLIGGGIGGLLGGAAGIEHALTSNRARAKALELLTGPEAHMDAYLASVARADEIKQREEMAWQRQRHQDFRADVRSYQYV